MREKCPFCSAQGEKSPEGFSISQFPETSETEALAKRRAENSKRQKALRETIILRLWLWKLRILYPLSGELPQRSKAWQGWHTKQQSMVMDTVVQWNIRSFRSNFEELKLINHTRLFWP
ncbi:hypothetical protein PoB_002728700 [Plakobranchus ocellatus]|uniref:Uncharacterized protein n=1 Tax=Plakobranchus ocellatus TaxID=259542 RepID=A0AAV4A1K3_9GAST|nr:hypothetical protein PoB_002728700 [Plakobranchus ocellatus]